MRAPGGGFRWLLLLALLLAPGGAPWAEGETREQPLELVLQAGHMGSVRDTSWRPDGALLTLGSDGRVLLWDFDQGRILQSFEPAAQYDEAGGRRGLPVAVVAGEGGFWSLHEDGRFVRWSWSQAEPVATTELFEDPRRGDRRQLLWSPQGSFLAHLGDRDWALVAPDETVRRFRHEGGIDVAALAPDGQTVALASRGEVQLFRDGQAVGEPLSSFASRWGVQSLAFEGDGRTLYVGTQNDWVEVWDTEQGRLVSCAPASPRAPEEAVLKGAGYSGESLGVTVAVFDEGHLLAVNRAGETSRLDKATLQRTDLLELPFYGADRLAIRADRKAVGVGFIETGREHLVALTEENGRWQSRVLEGRADRFSGLEVAGRHLLLVGRAQTLALDLGSGRQDHTFETGYFPSWAMGHDLYFAGGNDGVVRAWNLDSGRLIWEADLSRSGARFGRGILAMALSHDGRTLAVAESQTRNRVLLLEPTTGAVKKEWPVQRNVTRLAFSPRDHQLFVAQNRQIDLFDVSYGKVVHSWILPQSAGQRLVGMQVEPDGRHLRALDARAQLIDLSLENLEQFAEIRKLDSRWSATRLRREETQTLVCADNLVILLDSEGKQARSFGPHQATVNDARIMGGVVISTALDSRVHFWDLQSGRELASLLSLDQGREWLMVTPELTFDGSEGAISLIDWRWHGRNYGLEQFFERFYRPGLLPQLLGSDRRVGAVREAALGTPPPDLRIATPKEVEPGLFEVEVEVLGEPEVWTDLRLYHNGHRVPGQSPYRLRSVPGENRLKAVVYNQERTVESAPAEATFVCEVPREAGTLHVVAVGINAYAEAPLDFAVEDATAFAGAFGPGLFAKVEKTLLLDQEATKERLVATLQNLDCSPQDTLAVFLAGHGMVLEDRFHFVPYGVEQGELGALKAGSLSSQELGELLIALPATKQVLFLDTCHAGASAGELAELVVGKGPVTASGGGSALVRDQKVLARRVGTFLVAGSSPTATAAEVPELGHGLFTYALLQGLDEAPEGTQAGENGSITVNALLRYLGEKVPELSAKFQGRSQEVWQFSAGQDFPLARPLDQR